MEEEIFYTQPAVSDNMPTVICCGSDTTPQVSVGKVNNTEDSNGRLETDGDNLDSHPGASPRTTPDVDRLAMPPPSHRASTGNLDKLEEEGEEGEKQVFTEGGNYNFIDLIILAIRESSKINLRRDYIHTNCLTV